MASLNKLRSDMAQRFLDALNQGQLPWKACWQGARPVNAATGKLYRGVNAMYLSYIADERGYTDPRWCTYNQAKEKGWQVRKGATSAKVEYWAYYDRKQKKLLSWEEAGKLLDADPAYESNLQISSRTYPVFNAAQIDGIPALERNATDIGEIRAQRDTLVQNMGIGYQEYGTRAYYSPGLDCVTLPPEASFDDTYSYMSTFLHECGHASGHPDRLNRDLSGFFGSESYAREELRAEIASAFTVQALGLQLTDAQMEYHLEQHTAYIQSWASVLQKNPEELFRAIKAAEEISDYLIEKGEFDMERNKTPQLFKVQTIQQRKIMEWLAEQGVKAEDIASVQLSGPALVRVTNPAGQYMDVYCDAGNSVRILDVTEAREEELQSCFWNETNDPEDQEWRENLTADEAAMVEQWDLQTAQGFSRLASDTLERSAPAEQTQDELVHEAGKSLTAKFALEELADGSGLRLRFQGHGTIEGYISTSARPWQSQIGRIKEIIIEDGITNIGRNILSDFPAVEKITWPRSIKQSDPFALRNCPELKEIAIAGASPQRLMVENITSPYELLKLANRYPDLTREQLSEVAEDLRDGASWDEISIYAKPEFTAPQMNAIRCARDSGVTPKQIDLIANPRFSPIQMDIISDSFLCGMSMQEVQSFAKPELTAYQMLDAHNAIREKWQVEPSVPLPLSEGEIALQRAADDAEKQFWAMDAFLKKGGDIAELADWYEQDWGDYEP